MTFQPEERKREIIIRPSLEGGKEGVLTIEVMGTPSIKTVSIEPDHDGITMVLSSGSSNDFTAIGPMKRIPIPFHMEEVPEDHHVGFNIVSREVGGIKKEDLYYDVTLKDVE